MSNLLGSFPRCVRERPKCAGKTCVGPWGQSTVPMRSHRQSVGPEGYKWYQSNPATVANCVFSAPSRRKDPETTVQRGRCIPK